MMKIIVLVVIAICVSSQPNLVIQQTLTKMYGDSDGVLQCIAKLDTKMQANSVSKFCGMNGQTTGSATPVIPRSSCASSTTNARTPSMNSQYFPC